jgi:hypothetical protein
MVVRRPRAVLVTEVHVTGWLALVWADTVLAPLKRFIIEFPFVAEKMLPSQRKRATGGPLAVHQKYRLSPHGAVDETPSLLA